MKTYNYVEAVDEVPAYRQMIDSQGITWIIPIDPANSDYAEYLRYTAWIENGNNAEDFWSSNAN